MPTQPVIEQCDECYVSITGGDLCVECAIEACREAEREAMWNNYVTKSDEDGECDDGIHDEGR